MRRATAVAVAFVTAGTIVLFDAARPGMGMGITLLILAVALFGAGGVNERYRLLWIPFATVGAFLAALNFTSLDVPPEPTGSFCVTIGIGALLLAAGSGWLRSVSRRARL